MGVLANWMRQRPSSWLAITTSPPISGYPCLGRQRAWPSWTCQPGPEAMNRDLVVVWQPQESMRIGSEATQSTRQSNRLSNTLIQAGHCCGSPICVNAFPNAWIPTVMAFLNPDVRYLACHVGTGTTG